ncbi:MAG: tyrosine-type recombinase/integrase [Firmicutes bacterium]|nr:tyrosine-type recombinase/integrase [Bacillota bacterium]
MFIEDFEKYLREEKKLSDNTVTAYLGDIDHFERFVSSKGVHDLTDVTGSHIVAYIMELKKTDKSKPTVNRKLTSIKTFYRFLIRNGHMTEDPTTEIKSPRIDKKEIQFLTIEEVDRLMSLPDETIKGIRDKAILELMYATGIKASELIDLNIDDCNLLMGFVKCSGEHVKARIVPIGRPAKRAIERYLDEARPQFTRGRKGDRLFVNYLGEPMTRQGLWKVIKEYGEKGEFEVSLTPQIIRNSFAVHMLQNGADVKSLQELMGNEDVAAIQAYVQATKSRIKDVYDKAHPRA